MFPVSGDKPTFCEPSETLNACSRASGDKPKVSVVIDLVGKCSPRQRINRAAKPAGYR
ncbi:hypothetical protein IVW58_06540 [Salmonella enterica subsp. enterica serovar Worthington]|nr:hypothetical protein [Salmonella enterica subsp. enterica serovar Worthington]